jgi:hypothetical protein
MHSAAPDCYLWTRELLRFRQKLLKRISTAPSQRAREDPSWAEVVFQLSIALSIVDWRLSIALTPRRRRGAMAGFWTTGTKSSWTLEKANLLQEEEQDNQSLITGGHASMDVEVVEKNHQKWRILIFLFGSPSAHQGANTTCKTVPSLFFWCSLPVLQVWWTLEDF